MNSFFEAFFNTNHQPPSLSTIIILIVIVLGMSILQRYLIGQKRASQKPKKKHK